MAEIFNFYVQDNRTIQFPKNNLLEPIMQEDKDVATWRFRIPKVLNQIDMSGWSWWFVCVNAKGQKYSELLTLTDDIDEPSSYSTADYDIDYGISKFPGSFSFALEAINAQQGGEISGEWHTRTYSHKVDKTLQGNQAEYAETESDIISALMQEVRNKVNQLVGGATPLPVNLKSLMTDHDKVYLYTGSEDGESTGYWYYWNGVRFTPGGVYGAGDPESVQGYVENWLDNHPEATTTVQDGSISAEKLNTNLYKAYLRTESAMHFFPSLESGGYSGNSSLMVVKDKCVLFDCGPTVNWDAIKAYYDALYADGIFANIDYIVISHYHWDHIQNLANILQRYPHADCKVYLPLDPTGYAGGTSEVLSNRTQVLETLAEYNLQYVEVSVDTDITILDGICSVNLFNSTPEDYAYYSADAAAVYNDYSMCALVKTGEVYALYPGDIQREAQIRILATKSLPKLVLYSTHHHAIQNDDFFPYLDAIEPEIAVIQTSYVRGLISAASSFATNYASEHVYSCGYGACVVAVGKDGGSLVEGRELPKTGWYYSYVDYYVDNEYQGTDHFGTEEKPFTNINEALMFVRDNSNMHYIIHVKATATPYEYVWCRDFPVPIVLTGYADGNHTKPVVNGFYARNTADINLYNLDFTGTGREVNNIDCLTYASASTVYFSGCEFNNSGATFYSAIQCNLSTVYAASCIFNKLTTPFVTYRYAKFISNINTFTDCNKVYTVQNTDLTIRGADTITNCTNYIYAGNAGTKNITIKSVSSDSDLTALKALIALNDLAVVSLPFYCNGILSIVKGKAIEPIDSHADRGKEITSGENLNNYKTFGKYMSGATATTTSLTNTPTGVQGGFTLYVEPSSATYTKQILIDNNMQIFIRRLTSGNVWGPWFLIGMTQV